MTLKPYSDVGMLVSMAAMAVVIAASASDEQAAFKAFLARFEQGTTDFINGDPTLWKQNVSQRDDSCAWPIRTGRRPWRCA